MNNIEPAKIHIPPVQHIKTFRFIGYYIQEVDVMHGFIRKVYKGGNVGLYFEEGMYPYRCFGLSELCPPKYTQAQINGGIINRIYIAWGVYFQFTASFAPQTSFGNQDIGVVCKDPPVPVFIGISKIRFGDTGAHA